MIRQLMERVIRSDEPSFTQSRRFIMFCVVGLMILAWLTIAMAMQLIDALDMGRIQMLCRGCRTIVTREAQPISFWLSFGFRTLALIAGIALSWTTVLLLRNRSRL